MMAGERVFEPCPVCEGIASASCGACKGAGMVEVSLNVITPICGALRADSSICTRSAAVFHGHN